MTIRAFMNRELYNRLRNQVDGIPDNELPSKTQPHISVDLETFWNMICAMTGKNSLRTK